MQKVTYRAKFIKTGEEYYPIYIAFDDGGKMKELKVFANGKTEDVNPDDYEIIYVYDEPNEEEVEKIVEENKLRKEKFGIGRQGDTSV